MYARAVPSLRPTTGASRFATAAAADAVAVRSVPLVPPGQPGALGRARELGRLPGLVVALVLIVIVPFRLLGGRERRRDRAPPGAAPRRSTAAPGRTAAGTAGPGQALGRSSHAPAGSGPHGPLRIAEHVPAHHGHDAIDHQRPGTTAAAT